MAQEPINEGGCVRIADSANFPAAKTIVAALVNIEPGNARIALAPQRRMAVSHLGIGAHDSLRVDR
jgi:hypothetical protein